MALRWEPHGGGQPVVAWRAIDDDGFLVATVTRYDTHGGHWVARVQQSQVGGRFATENEAQAAAEEAAAELPPAPSAGDRAWRAVPNRPD